jgi:excisionase family DNA binding protein
MSMELMTVQEAASYLKVAPVTVRRYIAQGRLRALRVGRGVRVNKEAVERMPTAIRASRPTRLPKGRPTTADDPLWNIIGIADTKGPKDVSINKHKYLAEAYSDLHLEK